MFPPNFIDVERIVCQLNIGSKKRVLQQLGEMLASGTPDLSPEAVFEHLLERERLGSTGLGHGIALPHARMPQVEGAVGAFVQQPGCPERLALVAVNGWARDRRSA